MPEKRDEQWFDSWVRKLKMYPQFAVEVPEGKLLLADSEELIVEDERMFYRTGWGLFRHDKMEMANFAEYELNDPRTKQERTDDACFQAGHQIKILSDAGYFDDQRKGDFGT